MSFIENHPYVCCDFPSFIINIGLNFNNSIEYNLKLINDLCPETIEYDLTEKEFIRIFKSDLDDIDIEFGYKYDSS